MKDMENEVATLALWRSNLVGLATYFRTSKCRTKALAAAGNGIVVAFPAHHEENIHRTSVQYDCSCAEKFGGLSCYVHSNNGELSGNE